MTKIRDGFLNQQEDQPSIRDVLQRYTAFLNEHVAVSSHIHAGIHDEEPHIEFVIKGLYARLAELIDAASTCAAQGIFEPCSLFIRSATETIIYLLYINSENQSHRSLAFLIGQDLKSVHWNERLDPDTERGKAVRNNLEKHSIINHDWPRIDSSSARTRFLGAVSEPPIKEIWDSWDPKEKRAWYSYDSQAHNLDSLAKFMKLSYIYETYYRAYSLYTHSNIRNAFDNQARVYGIRSPLNAPLTVLSLHEIWKVGTVAIIQSLDEATTAFAKDKIDRLRLDAMVIKQDDVTVTWK